MILLVTGSRALADTRRAAAWARGEIAPRALDAHQVVAGDARGPDEWAQDLAPTWAERWCLDGRILARLMLDWVLEARWHNDPLPRRGDREGRRQLCLARDRAMVDHYAPRADEVALLALIAPWSRTRGTEYTARHAEAAGIAVERLVCPVEYGPEVTRG